MIEPVPTAVQIAPQAAAAKNRFALSVAATNDIGEREGFVQIGELHVHKKPKADTLALPL